MPKFFVDNITSDTVTLTGANAVHIGKSLRMKKGESLTLCNGKGTDYGCLIEDITADSVICKVVFETASESECKIKISLYQGLPKGDKMDTVVQKCVELGVFDIHPVLTERCISRPDAKSAAKKVKRLQKIADEAAKQSRRGILPKVYDLTPYRDALKSINADLTIFFYEKGGEKLKTVLKNFSGESIALIIGPEGGFSDDEVTVAKDTGAVTATLGSRILRTETAPIAAISNIVYELDE